MAVTKRAEALSFFWDATLKDVLFARGVLATKRYRIAVCGTCKDPPYCHGPNGYQTK